MKPLAGKIAVVSGASRGAGRGIAVVLGEAGATVYVAARTSKDVENVAAEVTARGGCGISVHADLSDEQQAAALFRRIEQEQGRLDVLANSAWSANFMAVWSRPFWELDSGIWRDTLGTVSVCWNTSAQAARLMKGQGRGLIIHVTDNQHDNPSAHRGQIVHDLGHECINRLILSMSRELRKSRIAVVGLNPGFMRTEGVMKQMTTDAIKKRFRFDLSETVEYIGRAVAALAADPDVFRKTGKLLWVAELAREYGFTDLDGRTIPIFDPKAPRQAFPC